MQRVLSKTHSHHNCSHTHHFHSHSTNLHQDTQSTTFDSKDIEHKSVDLSLHQVDLSLNQLENFKGMVLHLIFDLISSFFVVISCLLIRFYSFYLLDPICCFLVSVLIIVSSLPLTIKLGANLLAVETFDMSLLFSESVQLGS